MKRLTAWTIAALLCTSPLHAAAADTLDSRSAVQQETGVFMDSIAEGKLQAAYQHLRPHLGVDTEPYDQSARDAADYFDQVADKAGKTVATSHVLTEVIADDFTRETWLQKFRSAAIAWQFTFYRPDDSGWKLVGVSYSTDIENLYQPAP